MQVVVDEMIHEEMEKDVSSPNHDQQEEYLRNAGESEMHHYDHQHQTKKYSSKKKEEVVVAKE